MAGNIRIPKRVGAVKLPKKVRKKARKAIKAATSPFVRDFATAAMAAAGRARRERGRPEQEEHDMCQEFSARIDGSKIAEAFRKAAADGLRTFLEGLEEGLKKARDGQDDPQPEPQAKPEAAAKPKKPARPKPAKAKKPRPAAAKPGPRAPSA